MSIEVLAPNGGKAAMLGGFDLPDSDVSILLPCIDLTWAASLGRGEGGLC